jgi:hypothetical protein
MVEVAKMAETRQTRMVLMAAATLRAGCGEATAKWMRTPVYYSHTNTPLPEVQT